MYIRFDKRVLKENPVLLSVILLVLGLILFFFPGGAVNTIVQIIGWALLLGSAVTIINWVRNRKAINTTYEQLAGSIVGLLGGIFLVCNPAAIVSVFPLLMGVIILVNGCINLLKALDLKKLGYGSWKVPLLMAVVTVIAGLVICGNPFGVMATLVRIAGIVLVYNAVSNIWIATRNDKSGKAEIR